MRDTLRALLERVGSYLGRWCAYIPASAARSAAGALLILARGRLGFVAYHFSESFVAALFHRESEPVWFKRVFSFGATLTLDARKKTQRQMLYLPCYEAQLTVYIRETLKPGMTFLDVGAHVGYYTALGAVAVGEKGSVISVEPEASNFSQLKINIEQNGLYNVVLCKLALSDETGRTILYRNPLNDGGHTLEEPVSYRDSGRTLKREDVQARFAGESLEEEVSIDTGDMLLKNRFAGVVPDLIKIDVEHLELEVLQGFRKTITAPISPLVICEVTKNVAQVVAFMNSHGYDAFYFGSSGLKEVSKEKAMLKGNYLFKCYEASPQ